MTLDAKIASDIQETDLGELVVLWELDTDAVGGTIYRFTKTAWDATEIVFDGDTYDPLDVKESGFEASGKGQLPRPRVKVSILGDGMGATIRTAIEDGDDLVGCKVTRTRTFSKYLDAGGDPDTTAHFPAETYWIERKVHQDRMFVEWELASLMDRQGQKIPGRLILRDTCTHIYRVYDSGFDYDNATCPYTGSDYFKSDGTPTGTASEDACGLRVTDCMLRYGNDPLPTRAFPGVARSWGLGV